MHNGIRNELHLYPSQLYFIVFKIIAFKIQ